MSHFIMELSVEFRKFPNLALESAKSLIRNTLYNVCTMSRGETPNSPRLLQFLNKNDSLSNSTERGA